MIRKKYITKSLTYVSIVISSYAAISFIYIYHLHTAERTNMDVFPNNLWKFQQTRVDLSQSRHLPLIFSMPKPDRTPLCHSMSP